MKFSDLFTKPTDATEHVKAGFDKEKGVRLVKLLRGRGLSDKDVDTVIHIITDLQVDSFCAGGQFALDRIEVMMSEETH